MAEKEQILIEVQFDTSAVDKAKKALQENLQQLQKNKAELAAMNKAMKEGQQLTEEDAKRYAELTKAIAENKQAIAANTAIVNAAAETNESVNQTLNSQRLYLAELQKAFAGLTDEQKEAMGGQEHLQQIIKAVSDAVKDSEMAIGDARRNVGNYTESIQKAFGDINQAGELLGKTVSVLNGMGKEGKSAAALLGALQRIMQLVGKAGQVMAASTKAQTVATEGQTVAQEGLNAAMSANPIGLIVAAISTLLPLVQSLISAFTDATEEVDALNNELERQSRIIEQMQSDAAFEAKVAAIMGASAKEQLRIQLDAAKKARDIADAKVDDLLSIMLNGSKKEREAAKEAYDAALEQQKAAQDRVTQLNESYTLQNLTDLKKAEEDKQKVIDEAANQRKAKAEENAQAEREAAIQHMEDMRLLAEAELATAQARFEELQEQSKEWLESLNEDEEDNEEEPPTVDELCRKVFGLDEEVTEYFKQQLEDGVDFATAKTNALGKQWDKNAKNILAVTKNVGGAIGSMGDIIGELAGDNEKAMAAQRAFALTSIITNQAASIAEGALALAEGIRTATEIGFPQNIPAIISITATIGALLAGIASTISQAKQVFSQSNVAEKFETGGVIGGTSYHGDHISVQGNSREMMLPMSHQKVLYDYLSQAAEGQRTLGFDYELMAMANASLPSPTVVYTELQEFGQKVSTYQEIASV